MQPTYFIYQCSCIARKMERCHFQQEEKQMSAPIDFVIMWVDGNDPEWQKEKNKYLSEVQDIPNKYALETSCGAMRYRDWDNLQYWFRGVEKFAPWVHKIYFVTWGHVPTWLNTEHPKLVIVNHKDFIPEEYLPTFQSPAIEDNVHRIPGLSEQFVLFNDDTFLIKKCRPTDFFVKDLPCDCAILNTESFSIDEQITYTASGMAAINGHFQKHEAMKANWSKWFNLKYFPNLIRTFLLLPWRKFQTLYQPHLPSSFLKSTFETVWGLEHDILDKTCREKFRRRDRVSQYLFLDWQRVTGQFSPRSTHIGKTFYLGNNCEAGFEPKTSCSDLCKHIVMQKTKMICVNDIESTEADFVRDKKLLNEAFQTILPEKCAYEK